MATHSNIKEPDRSLILDTISAYSVYYDEDQLDIMRQQFSDSPSVIVNADPDNPVRISGLDDVMAMYRQARADVREQNKRCRHFSTNPLFTSVHSDRVTVRVNMLYIEKQERAEVSLAGQYLFELINSPQSGWVIDQVVIGYDF